MTLFDPPEPITGPAGSTVRVRLDLGYDGTGFHGFAANAGVRTVAGVLAEQLERLLGHPVALVVAGRTDRGVHARHQVVSFDAAQDRFDPDSLVRSINKLCGPEVAVSSATVAPPDFDARHDAIRRTYRYRILNRRVPDPFTARLAWHVGEPLDIAPMRLAVDGFVGEHDFSSFCRRNRSRTDEVLVRRVRRGRVWRDGDELWVELAADAFCHQMVRSIVGTLVAVGARRRRAGEVNDMLAARDRHAAPPIAPPHGLMLWEVRYD